jgi:hypothetical protein
MLQQYSGGGRYLAKKNFELRSIYELHCSSSSSEDEAK